MLVVSCSHGIHLGPTVAKKLRSKHSKLFFSKFPDDEIYIRFDCGLRGMKVVLVQSFYKNINDCLIEAILAARTAEDLGAKKIILAAPYFPYLRQDKKFHNGEAVSQKIIAGLMNNYFDEILIMDPHLHRESKLGHIFKIKSKKLTANSLIADYIKKNIKNPVIIGTDEESYKWAKSVAELIGVESRILEKKRYSSYHVEVKLSKKIDLKNKNAVIVDDIVSTGHTILETANKLRKFGAGKIYCICVHGIFVNSALEKLQRAGIKVISTNTIPSRVARIDVGKIFGDGLK